MKQSTRNLDLLDNLKSEPSKRSLFSVLYRTRLSDGLRMCAEEKNESGAIRKRRCLSPAAVAGRVRLFPRRAKFFRRRSASLDFLVLFGQAKNTVPIPAEIVLSHRRIAQAKSRERTALVGVSTRTVLEVEDKKIIIAR
jgi:hypothetical protein